MISLSDNKHQLVPLRTVFEDRKIKPGYLYLPTLSEILKFGLAFVPLFPKKPVQTHKIRFREEFKGHDWLYFYFMLFSIGMKLILVNEPLYYYRYRLTPGSDSTSYSANRSQIHTLTFLETFDWLDKETKDQIKQSKKLARYRLVATALRNGLWQKDLIHFAESPLSIFYLLNLFFPWYIRRKKLRNLIDYN